jgi:hypothetical protein
MGAKITPFAKMTRVFGDAASRALFGATSYNGLRANLNRVQTAQ